MAVFICRTRSSRKHREFDEDWYAACGVLPKKRSSGLSQKDYPAYLIIQAAFTEPSNPLLLLSFLSLRWVDEHSVKIPLSPVVDIR
jgi:hypothetical protein